MSPALILLAAGASTRMGRPKQLLPYRGVTLLRHAAHTALASRCRRVVVVLGSQAPLMQTELRGLPIQSVINIDWASGMGSSIRAGLAGVLADSSPPPAVLIMLCDQPAVTADVLNQLIEVHGRQGSPIVACAYAGVAGVPALFDQSVFPELLALHDSEGARKLIEHYGAAVARIDFPPGIVDVDTAEDYQRILR